MRYLILFKQLFCLHDYYVGSIGHDKFYRCFKCKKTKDIKRLIKARNAKRAAMSILLMLSGCGEAPNVISLEEACETLDKSRTVSIQPVDADDL